jgi:MYXO-CTERM domain-containing protein
MTLWMCAGLYLLWPLGHVRTDAVGPPPEKCPPGAEGESDHVGEYCRASVCAADSDCPDGRMCREYPLCVGDYTYESSRGNTRRSVAHGECGAGQQCERGKCVAARRCVPRTFFWLGCSVAEPGDGSGLGLVAVLAFAGWRRRRAARTPA